ncbi:MAG: hypothetical protein ACHREM_09230 [Polyangiales bacterium]
MSGPRTSADALVWIREAVATSRYLTDPHFEQQARKRRFDVHDAKKIIATATACEPYTGQPLRADGTSWRVTGKALDGSTAKLGVEAFLDHLGKRVIFITIMDG